MHRVTQPSLPEIPQRKSLSRRIRAAEETYSRNVREAAPPTLTKLLDALFFCPGAAPEELKTEPPRRGNLLKRVMRSA